VAEPVPYGEPATGTAASADRHDRDLDVGRLRFEDLEGSGADASDQVGLVARGDEAHTGGIGVSGRGTHRVVETLTGMMYIRAKAPNPDKVAAIRRLGANVAERIPCTSAAKAIDWPWFPVEALTTPAARSSSPKWPNSVSPPRTLKALTGFANSSFRDTSASSSSVSAGELTRGDGSRSSDAISAAANRTSSSVEGYAVIVGPISSLAGRRYSISPDS